ncbi:CIR protein [Plasmodium chabaudi adami]|uniref:CIR protein n=1 Tax=Plasmodium chabaudi adami TaxID=5826 RepID=A0A1C6WXE0_PLACE|nr:CIR protein [Plasmodium chabaudi adami]
MFKNLCEAINGIDKLIKVEVKNEGIEIIRDTIFDGYCPTNKGAKMRQQGQDGHCIGYSETVISAFIQLLKNIESDDGQEKLESDKRAQYAILWLCYKINQQPNVNAGINDIYNNFTEYEYWTREYNSYIEQIKKLMDMDIKDIPKFYDAFEILCKMYTEFDDDTKNCTNCSDNAEEFVKRFGILNGDSNHKEGSSYSQILSTLSNDYGNLKNNCTNFPPLPQLTPKKSSAQNPGHSSKAISSNSSIANTLIPVSSIFAAIPIFLGIAYKYSLFGIDKLLQRQYLRKKLKKIKKKMEHYI